MNKQIELNTTCGNSKALTTDQLWMVNTLKEAIENKEIFKAQILEIQLQNLGINLEMVYAQ